MAETRPLTKKPALTGHTRMILPGLSRAGWRAVRRLLVLCTAGLMAAGMLGGPAARAATAPRWSIVASPNRTGFQHSQLDGVSCATATACTAVGSALNSRGVTVPLAKAWNGRKWAAQHVPVPAGDNGGELTAVSCTSATACTAVGQSRKGNSEVPVAERWNGIRWAVQSVPVPGGSGGFIALAGVSCTSATACIAVGTASGPQMPLAEAWNGVTWTIQTVPVPAGSESAALSAVSCSSATACVAVGRSATGDEHDSVVPVAEAWNGATWTVQTVPVPAGPAFFATLAGVSCTSVTACIAVGSNSDTMTTERWNGTKWAIQAVPAGAAAGKSALSGVSCTSATACTAAGPALATRWNGTKWAIQHTARPGNAISTSLSAVSCTSARRCTAVGYYHAAVAQPTLAERWNGVAWRVQSTPGGPGIAANNSLAAVSCVSATACTAVGNYNPSGDFADFNRALAERWNGTTWAIQQVPGVAGERGDALSGVSCTSARACTAVGDFVKRHGQLILRKPLAERWNGVRWAIQPTPAPAAEFANTLSAVSCASQRACMAVGSYGDMRNGKAQTHVLAERWNGRKWAVTRVPVPSGNSGTVLNGVSCTSARTCVAVGDYLAGSPGHLQYHTLTERWNGRAWAIQRTPVPAGQRYFASLYAVSCTSARACTAIGGYDNAAGGVELAERWNGTRWIIQPVPVPAGAQPGYLSAVSCASARSCTAVSTVLESAGGETALAEHWNGTKWAAQPIPNPPGLGEAASDLLVSGVSCALAASCAAVGSYNLIPSDNSSSRTLAERYGQ